MYNGIGLGLDMDHKKSDLQTHDSLTRYGS